MRRTIRKSLQAAPTLNNAAASYDVIVVGGGLTGCLVGSRLAMDNLKVLVLEEGCNISKQPKWHRQIGCALHAHRHAKRGYETLTTTIPQRSLDSDDDARKDAVEIPSPRVLGGSGVMGSRSWFFGDAADWDGVPVSFRDELMPRIQRLEALEIPQPHRGKHGKFTVSRSKAVSPFYRPFTEAMNSEMSLVSNWNRLDGAVFPGCGRPEVLVDPTTLTAHQTLDTHVAQALGLKRPLDVRTDTRVVGIVGNGKDSATGVRIADRDGSLVTISSSVVVLAAGTIGSAKVVDASHSQFASPIGGGEAGKNFWDCPSVVLQFKSHDPVGSHHCYFNSVVQLLLGAQLQLGNFTVAMSSSYDDVMALWSSNGTQQPDVKILIQPFVMNVRGDVPATVENGFQIIVELARPSSRGVVTAGSVDPNYFDQKSDREALQRAVGMVKAAIQRTASMTKICDPQPFAEVLQSRGVCGGSLALGKAVDPASQLVVGTSNVYCCDGSILPRPLIGDRTPHLLALGERFADKYLNKAELTARVDRAAPLGPGETRIIY